MAETNPADNGRPVTCPDPARSNYNGSMLKPPRLRPGDLVAVAAPASPIQESYLKLGVAEIESLGFHCRYDPEILSRHRYLAGTDERRFQELQQMLADPDVKAIVFARGGYGSGRMLGLLEKRHFPRLKILCGYSDVTALHLHVHSMLRWITLYGPMAAWDFARGPRSYNRESFLSAVFGECQTYGGLRVIRPGKPVRGRLLGGCLSLLQCAVGTVSMPDLTDAILLLEDEHVKPYQLDRMLHHLRWAGALRTIRAVVFGEMPHCTQADEQGYELSDVIQDAVPHGIPVVMNLPAGHAVRVATVPLGVQAELDPEKGELRILEPAVA